MSVAKDCFMIPSDVNLAIITATPSTDLNKAEIKIEPISGHILDVIIHCIYTYICNILFL